MCEACPEMINHNEPEPTMCGLWGCGRKASGKVITVAFGFDSVTKDLPPRNIDVCEYHFGMIEDSAPKVSMGKSARMRRIQRENQGRGGW